MKACLLTQFGPISSAPLTLQDLEIPQPQAGEALIQVSACGICRTDLHVIEGELPATPLPMVPGHQVVGTVERLGAGNHVFSIGDRVGVAWLRSTCGKCHFCLSGRENLCEAASFNGWKAYGGYAEYMTAPADFIYKIPETFSDLEAAPLLCAGIIGYRSLKLCGLRNWKGSRIGLYGFGAAAHVAIQLLKRWGADIYVVSREEKHRELAGELGASWVGPAGSTPPKPLEAAIIYAPAGELIPEALKAVDRGGVVVCAGIHMSPIPSFEYTLLYGERVVRSVMNNTRQDGLEFLEEAARHRIRTRVTAYSLEEANQALLDLKEDRVKGAAVLDLKTL